VKTVKVHASHKSANMPARIKTCRGDSVDPIF
jgi:hypothetical protein